MWLGILLLLLLAAPAGAVTCTVTSTADSGAGSFRQAVTDANAASCDTIDFNIIGAGVHTIALGSQVVVTAANVTIDGSTQSGSSRGDLWGGTPPVWNIAVTGNFIAFDATATGGVLIGLDIAGVGASGSGVSIKACYLHGANQGVNVQADSVTIGGVNPGDGNVISGNTNEGIAVFATTGLVVQGNFICTDKTGMTAEPNTFGVNLEGAASATIGGLGTAKNLISGCSVANVSAMNGPLSNPSVWPHDAIVQYNLIGTDKTGLAPIAGATPAIGINFSVQNAEPTPGPATPGIDNFNIHHNTVSANDFGIKLGSVSFTSINNTTVAFNNIGTDVNGAQAVGLCNLTADLLDFGTASDIHDNNLCTFTPTPTPIPTGCGAISTNPSGLTCIDAAMETASGTDCTTFPGSPSQGSQACCNSIAAAQSYCTGDTGTTCSVDSDCAGGATGPCVIVTCTFTAGGACSPATFPEGAIGGACVAGATETPTATPTVTPTATGPTPTPGITPGCCALVGAPLPGTCLDNAWFASHPEFSVTSVASLADCQAASVVVYGQDFVTAYNAVECVNGIQPDHTDGRCGAAPRKHGFSGGAVINVQ